MLKKILIGLLIIVIIASTTLYITYKKVEAQFESFVHSEIARREAEIDKALEEKIGEVDIPKSKQIVTPKESVDITLEVKDVSKDSESQIIDKIVQGKIEERVAESKENGGSIVISKGLTDNLEKKEIKEEVKKEAKEEVIKEVKEVKGEEIQKEEVTVEEVDEASYESDKAKALAMAISRLTGTQITRLIDISKDGFTAEEKKEAKEMFYGNFSEEEQEWILSIYSKYY